MKRFSITHSFSLRSRFGEVGSSRRKRFGGVGSLLLTALFSLLFFLLCFYSAREKSITTDEVAHIPAGFMIWKTGDYRINPEHPPLVKLLAALPLLPFNFYVPTKDIDWLRGDEWHFGGYFLFMYNDADIIAMLSQLPIMLIGIILGWGVYFWGRELFASGRGFIAPFAGLFAAAIFFTEPNLIAHSSLVTYDLPFAGVTFFAGYAYWALHIYGFNTKRLFIFILCMTLAPLVKVVGFFLWGLIFFHLFISAIFFKKRWRLSLPLSKGQWLERRGKKLLFVIVLFSLCAIFFFIAMWAIYSFRFRISPGLETPPGDQCTKYLNFELINNPLIRGVLNTLKENRLFPQGYLTVFGHALLEKEKVAILLGKTKLTGGFYSYFVITTLLKTPYLHLALISTSLSLILWNGVAQFIRRREWKKRRRFSRRLFYTYRAEIPLYLIIGFFIIITLSMVNLGHRLILMVIPIECLLAGSMVELFLARLRPFYRNALGAVLLIVATIPALNNYPNYISYFNPFIHDRKDAIMYLADSNVDWGQDMKKLGQYMQKNVIEKVNLSFFGTADPFYYGVQRWVDLGSWMILIPRHKEKTPDYTCPSAISANMLTYQNDKHPELMRTGMPILIGGSIYLFPPATQKKGQDTNP
jgi:hypothetical protein